MIKLNITTLDGENKVIEAEAGGVLMEPLRDAGLIDATCGGAASCGTCHVYASEDDYAKMGERTEDEGYMLESLADFVEVKEPGSRLCCQVPLTDALDGIDLTIAPEA